MAEVKLWVPLHQAQDRAERAFGGLPGVSHGPQPGQIEMGMAQQREPRRALLLPQPVAQVGHRGTVVGIALQQGFQFLECCGQVLLQQLQLAGE